MAFNSRIPLKFIGALFLLLKSHRKAKEKMRKIQVFEAERQKDLNDRFLGLQNVTVYPRRTNDR